QLMALLPERKVSASIFPAASIFSRLALSLENASNTFKASEKLSFIIFLLSIILSKVINLFSKLNQAELYNILNILSNEFLCPHQHIVVPALRVEGHHYFIRQFTCIGCTYQFISCMKYLIK